jgi:hypothetical protein
VKGSQFGCVAHWNELPSQVTRGCASVAEHIAARHWKPAGRGESAGQFSVPLQSSGASHDERDGRHATDPAVAGVNLQPRDTGLVSFTSQNQVAQQPGTERSLQSGGPQRSSSGVPRTQAPLLQ